MASKRRVQASEASELRDLHSISFGSPRFLTASKRKDEGLEGMGRRSERGCFEAEGGVKNAKESP